MKNLIEEAHSILDKIEQIIKHIVSNIKKK
jgi:hypothetical protein